ncbi:hypothetical protein D3C73_710520 [compost metagenome]
MRSRYGHTAHRIEFFQNSDCKRGPFIRLCTTPDLIEEQQGVPIGLPHDLRNILHMRGKGTECILHTLIISNIHENFIENSHFRIRIRCNMEARHGRECN